MFDQKGITHCGECDTYPCAKWEQRHGLSREDAVKKLGQAFADNEFKEFIEAYDNSTRLANL